MKNPKNYKGKKCLSCGVDVSIGSKLGFCFKHRPKIVMSESAKELIRQSKLGDKNPQFGKPLSLEVKKKISIANTGEKNHQWKGAYAGYGALHDWIKKHGGPKEKCVLCGKSKGRLEWANKSREYLRIIEDWFVLCKKCHVNYDDTINRGWKTKRLHGFT